jgi:integrase
VLRSALLQAWKWGLLFHDPVTGVQLPRESRSEVRVLTVEQVRIFVNATLGTPYGPVFAVAVTTGMRPSGYLVLTWRDIDWERGAVRVARTLHGKGGQWHFADTKRARSRRVIKLQNWVVGLLRDLRGARAQATVACDAQPEADLLFTTASGEPINEDRLARKHFKSILKNADLPDLRLYDLRHTAATLALTAGVPPEVVSEQLGHASAASTLDVYSHVLPHMQEEAAAKVESSIAGIERVKNQLVLAISTGCLLVAEMQAP